MTSSLTFEGNSTVFEGTEDGPAEPDIVCRSSTGLDDPRIDRGPLGTRTVLVPLLAVGPVPEVPLGCIAVLVLGPHVDPAPVPGLLLEGVLFAGVNAEGVPVEITRGPRGGECGRPP